MTRSALVWICAAVLVVASVAAGCSDDGTSVRSETGGASSPGSGSGSGPASAEVTPAAGADSITVYSGQHQQTVSALVEDFHDATGIGVSLRSGGEGELANQIIQEGSNSPADVFYAGNSPALEALNGRGLLAPVAPGTLAAVPRADSAPNGDWVGVSARSSVLVYDPSQVTKAQLPAHLVDLAKPEWKGRIGFSPNETDFQPLIATVVAEDGEDAARTWLEGLKSNGTTFDDNEAIIAAVDRGDIAAGLVEHYYWYRLRDEVGASDLKAALYYFPAGDPGGLLAVSGAGILESSDHAEAAQSFLQYLVSARGQKVLAESTSYEYPLRPGVTNPSLTRTFGELQPPAVSIEQLGDGRQAFTLLQEVGLL